VTVVYERGTSDGDGPAMQNRRRFAGFDFAIDEPGFSVVDWQHVIVEANRRAMPGGGQQQTGNLGRDITLPFFAIKTDTSEKLSFGFRYTQPYGLDAQYPPGTPTIPPGTTFPQDIIIASGQGTGGDFGADEYAFLTRYKINDNHSVFGSLRIQNYSGDFNRGGVTFDFGSDWKAGYSVGYAFEVPAKRLLFTAEYRSAIEHDNRTTALNAGPGLLFPGPSGPIFETPGVLSTPTIHRTPESITLNFRTVLPFGDGRNLFFGRYRWANWSEANINLNGINPTQFEDTQLFSLGFGRAVTDQLALTLLLDYRLGAESPLLGLTPFENAWGVGIGARYIINDNVFVQAAYSRITFTDAVGSNGGVFQDNDADAFAIKVGYFF